jgi:opacity protein-like surface antigen
VTVHEHDTVWAQLPREAKVYQDSAYRAKVTGYDPVLEEIQIYQKTKVVTVQETTTRYKMDRLTFGINAGYGLSGAGVSPYIGVGVSYNLFSLDNIIR